MTTPMNFEQARFNMIEQQIRPWEVLDSHVLQLLSVVKREDFVPLAHKALAFVDMQIPLPPQTHPSQCMLEPKVEARILHSLREAQSLRDDGGGTVVVVAYRKATIALADEVVYLDHGRVTGRGAHAELLETSEGYRDLVNAYERAEAEQEALDGGEEALA